MTDPTFISRCQLWAALWNLIPEAAEKDAERYINALDRAYRAVVAVQRREAEHLAEQLEYCRAKLDASERVVRDALAMAQHPHVTH